MENNLKNSTKKMKIGAGVAAVLCLLALIISIVLSGEYTGRAGNESKSEFLITMVDEKKQATANSGTENNTSNSGASQGNDSNTGSNQGNTSNQNNNSTTGSNQGSTSNQNKPTGNTGNGNTGTSNTEYDPRDTNKDGTVGGDEEARYITPEKQACIDAGYGVVVEMNGGEWYAVLMKSNEHTINGQTGFWLLEDYLKERGLGAHTISGCWINSDNNWYWYSAREIYELPDDGFNLEDGEIEFID